MSAHVLYRMYDIKNRLLYIGLTSDPPARFKNHKFNRWWWDEVANIGIEQFQSQKALRAAEARAIRDEGPLYNVHNNADPGFDFDLCECDDCDIDGECDECDECSGRRGKYVIVNFQEAS